MNDRGQALALEGTLAALLIVLSLLFALQVTAVTPLTESTSSQHIENQQKAIGHNHLNVAVEDGSLKSTILYWNDEDERYEGSHESEGYYTNGVPTDTGHSEIDDLGEAMDTSFNERGIAYNLYVNHVENEDDTSSKDHRSIQTEQVVFQGEPSDHAVTVTRTITLYESDTLTGEGIELDDSSIYIENVTDESHVYNVVEVELVIWRM